MKGYIYKFSLIFTAIILLLSCSSDDGDEPAETSGFELVGTWQLTQINVNEPIDVNNDQIASVNLLDEVPCLEDTLILGQDFKWTSTAVTPAVITAITGNLYNVSCSEVTTTSGNWGFSPGVLGLTGNSIRTLSYDGTILTETLESNLPGVVIVSLVYER